MTSSRVLQMLVLLAVSAGCVLALMLPRLIEREGAERDRRVGPPSLKTSLIRSGSLIVLLLMGFFGQAYLFRTFPFAGQPRLPERTLEAPGGRLTVEIADSDREREEGLSGRRSLPAERGMLFLFSEPGTPRFWMDGMRFSIDILYLRDGIVQEIFAAVPPPGEGNAPKAVAPARPADAVLEVFAGESARRGWVPGTRLFIPAEVR